ncbi:VWA domain-containing protein [Paralimibaculum aggregatum]|uniref:VWA domain-containing protein n=1 Tax=Paralimibaculum aggregatum TaxID=3036245 RepID=A0ABQ6LMG6_9RHOB|nr:VWA domain-containing protein [Limibaculum sp. NKW23]GMG84378.1 VWA domain-containing protein [Limibaculum sp. NKW23]
MSRAPGASIAVPEHGRLATNIVHFGRALRAAGLPVGPSRIVEAIRAVEAGGLERREDLYHTLAACLLSRREHRSLFDQCFHMFWRDPKILEQAMGLLLPEIRAPAHEREKKAAEARAAQALTAGSSAAPPRAEPEGEEIEFDASLSFSDAERLRGRDFEQMTAAEEAAARRAIARLSLPVRPIATRRTRPEPHGALPDWRATMRDAMRRGGEMHGLARRGRRQRWPALVALCDISGSMASYSRMLLHFLHAAANARQAGWSRVHAFTFGTRLTNISRHMAHRDVDEALARSGAEVLDWEGGTRIGGCLEEFNRDWSRRVLAQGAVVLLITDGLDRDDPGRLAAAAERLHLSCRRLIWLNPLLRWDGFEAKAAGIRALLPHVDSFRAAHSIASLEALSEALTRPDDSGEKARLLRAAGA